MSEKELVLGQNDSTLQALIDRVEPDLLQLFGTSEIVYIGKEFLRADANGDGELDQEEILEILHTLPESESIADAEALDLIRSLDFDLNGKVSFEEILISIASNAYCQDDILESIYRDSTTIKKIFKARKIEEQKDSFFLFENDDNPKDRLRNPRYNRLLKLSQNDDRWKHMAADSSIFMYPVFFQDGGCEHFKITSNMTTKMVCFAIKTRLKFQEDTDFTLFIQDPVGNILRRLNEDEPVLRTIETMAHGPFFPGEHVLVKAVDVSVSIEETVLTYLSNHVWGSYAQTSPEYIVPMELKSMIEDVCGTEISEKKCERIMDSIDADKNRKISQEELVDFVAKGLVMSVSERNAYGKKSDTHKTLVTFFAALGERMSPIEQHGVIQEIVTPGLRILKNGLFAVEIEPKSSSEPSVIDIEEKNVKRMFRIVYRRKIFFPGGKFEAEASTRLQGTGAAHRLRFAECYHRFITDAYQPSIGKAIDFAALLLAIDMVDFSNNETEDLVLQYGHSLGPYLPRRIISYFRRFRKEDRMADRIKRAMSAIKFPSECSGRERQIWAESMFVARSKACFGDFYSDIFFRTRAKIFLLEQTKSDPIIDVGNASNWDPASLGFGYNGVHIVNIKKGAVHGEVTSHYKYADIVSFISKKETNTFAIWTKQEVHFFHTLIPDEIEMTMKEYIQNYVDVRKHGERQVQKRVYSAMELETLFKTFDADQSGGLDHEEIRNMLFTLGADPSPSELNVILKKMDSNNSGVIEFDEFAEVWESLVQKYEKQATEIPIEVVEHQIDVPLRGKAELSMIKEEPAGASNTKVVEDQIDIPLEEKAELSMIKHEPAEVNNTQVVEDQIDVQLEDKTELSMIKHEPAEANNTKTESSNLSRRTNPVEFLQTTAAVEFGTEGDDIRKEIERGVTTVVGAVPAHSSTTEVTADGVFESPSPKVLLGEALHQEELSTQKVLLPMSELPASDQTSTNLSVNVEHPGVHKEVVWDETFVHGRGKNAEIQRDFSTVDVTTLVDYGVNKIDEKCVETGTRIAGVNETEKIEGEYNGLSRENPPNQRNEFISDSKVLQEKVPSHAAAEQTPLGDTQKEKSSLTSEPAMPSSRAAEKSKLATIRKLVNDNDGDNDFEFSFWNYLGFGNALEAWDRMPVRKL